MEKNYELTVITPFHNVDKELFKNAVDSMLSQTYGFENIEWIIVMHNCEESYLSYIKELLGDYLNVRIQVLNNEKHTPSSPRNYALGMATGEYVGFLDGDDMYRPTCLGTALAHIKSTDSDICSFRREYEVEKEGQLVLNEKVFWDQSREEIVLTRETMNEDEIFCGIWGISTSKLYKKSFMDKYNIRFDETIPFAENYAMNLIAYGHAKRICLLPQLIGYCYYVNGASLVQDYNKSNEELIEYARGFKKIFDSGLNQGLYMHDIMGNLLFHESWLISNSTCIDQATRDEIRSILEPYVKMYIPAGDSKLYEKDFVENVRRLPQAMIIDAAQKGTSEECAELVANNFDGTMMTEDRQVRILKEVLEGLYGTDIAKHYGFDTVISRAGFSSKMPVLDREYYRPMTELMIRIGETGIYTNQEVVAYAIDYGHNDSMDLYAYTKKHLDTYIREFEKIAAGKTCFLIFEGHPYKSKYEESKGLYMDSAMGIMISEYYRRMIIKQVEAVKFTSPIELLFPEEMVNADYQRMLFALKNPQLDIIYAANTWEVISAIDFLKMHHEQLVDDIENGRISYSHAFSEELLETLNKQMAPDKQRAEELREAFGRGFDGGILKRIWPSLEAVMADTGASNAIYTDRVNMFAEGISVKNGLYVVPEGVLGVPSPQNDDYVLNFDGAFYEFRDESGSLIVDPDIGGIYTLIISNLAGLVRCDTGRKIRVTGRENEDIYFVPCCYDGLGESTMSEIKEEDVYDCVRLCNEKLNGAIVDFSFISTSQSDRHILLLEPTAGMGGAGKIRGMAGFDGLAAECDRILMESSPRYSERRKSNELKEMVIEFCEPETHVMYRETVQYKRNTSIDVVPPIHMVENPKVEKQLLFYKENE